jgi:tRNA(Ile2) C34 agmatinyltransferase TiaS
MDGNLIGFLIMAGVYTLGALITYIFEYITFNNGKCSCGGLFEYFDTDSQGGRGYSCKKCHKTLWISYFVDKKYVKE